MNNQLPPIWEKVSFATMKTLGSWMKDALSRIEFMRTWLVNGLPVSFPLPVFFFPQGFMTGTLQTFARKYMVAIDTPSSGCVSGGSNPQMPNLNDSVSMATMYFLAKVCKVPVIKPCGKKKTGNGKLTGRPLTNQVRMNSMRDSASFIQLPSVFIVAKDTFSQIGGSWLFISPTYMSSRSLDMIAS